MKVLYLSSEVHPFAKTGGLADVAGSLPPALKAHGVDIRIFMPKYTPILRKNGINTRRETEIKFYFAGREWNAGIDIGEHRGVPVYFLDIPELYNREGIYGEGGNDYKDNALRFAAFSRAALELAKSTGFIPDVFHLNDWQTSLLPYYKEGRGEFSQSGTLLTIHNLAYQGVFDRSLKDKLELKHDEVIHNGMLNFLKAGIVASDIINTVSPTYAREIQTPEYGYGLDEILRSRSQSLYGILNGLDTEYWNPEKDPQIFFNYSVETAKEGKEANRRELSKLLGFENPEFPLIGIVTRLAHQKGIELVLESLEFMKEEDVNFVLLGTGDKKYEEALEKYLDFPRFSIHITFDPVLAKRIYAASDIFLMPSLYEPCGLGQMIAMRYGALPLVRKTGGLRDTVTDVDEDRERGNGFVFEKFSPDEFIETLKRAIEKRKDEDTWFKYVKRAMSEDFSWGRRALEYKELYVKAQKSN